MLKLYCEISAPRVLPAVKEAAEEEEPEEEEEEEEVKPPPITPAGPAPILKRTVSVAYPIKGRDPPQPTVQKVCPCPSDLSQPPPIKKTVNKVRQPQPACKDHPQQPQQPTPTNIYGREQRNERAKQKTEKMCNLFVNAFSNK